MKIPMRRLLLTVAASAFAAQMAAAQDVTLDVVAWKGNEAEPAGLPQLIEKFESENPGISVELNYVARKDVDKVVPPRLQGGNPPDVTMVDTALDKLWGGAGFLTDLGQDSEWYERIDPQMRAIIAPDEKVHMMPLEVIGMGNFVNLDLLEKVGITDVPLTVEAVKEACTRLNEAGISPMIFAGGFPAMLWVGANAIDPEGASPAEYGSGERKFVGDENFEASLDSVRELVDAQCFDPKLQAGLDPWSTAIEEFIAGRVAMLPHGAWNMKRFSGIEGLNFVFAPMPSIHSDNGLALDLVGPGWAIPTEAANADAARKLVDFFAKPENLDILLQEEGAYSPFEGGANGMPDNARLYGEARAAGDVILWPFSTLEFPKTLQSEWEDGLTGFLLNLDAPNADTLRRWDDNVEDNL